MLDLAPLGAAVRAARQRRNRTLKDLAEASGVSLRFLSDLEKGRGNISIARLTAVARALDVPLAHLVAPLDGARPAGPRVALVGLRGAGKSSVGPRVAAVLEVPFVELDDAIESAAGLPLGQIFEIHGEAYYRRLEREVLRRTLAEAPGGVVLAAGGGIVTDPESWDLLRRETHTVWLEAPPEAHYARVMAQGDLRPMENRPSAMAELRERLAARRPLYAQARSHVDTRAGLEAAAARVLEAASA